MLSQHFCFSLSQKFFLHHLNCCTFYLGCMERRKTVPGCMANRYCGGIVYPPMHHGTTDLVAESNPRSLGTLKSVFVALHTISKSCKIYLYCHTFNIPMYKIIATCIECITTLQVNNTYVTREYKARESIALLFTIHKLMSGSC